jgi:hypothetical protein
MFSSSTRRIRPLVAETRKIRVNQSRIPLHDVVVFELQSLARRMRTFPALTSRRTGRAADCCR